MSTWPPADAEPFALEGTPFQRGLAQAAAGRAACDAVRRVTADRLTEAETKGLLTTRAGQFLDAQMAFARSSCMPELEELSGVAEGFGIPVDRLFAALHLGILHDLSAVPDGLSDGCSAWAVDGGKDGPIVVKNRDFSGAHSGIQRVFRHEGPDLAQGPMFCLGSLGSPGAYSSGMNGAGLAIVDTQIGTHRHRPGWLRYFLMTRLLSQFASVADAVRFIRAQPHVGGGSLVMADAQGDVAAIELGTTAVAVEMAPRVCRTNHFTSTMLALETLTDPVSTIEDTSHDRRAFLDRTVPGAEWSAQRAARLMATHRGDASQAGPLCQHPDAGGTRTISSVVYCCASRLMYACLDNPCTGPWHLMRL
ncbi:C45 family autoproteolytic acyltransferase/hydolase [Solirhodobacter olei]|uniref:C45 family autoproteolytic acyltransferase/hydolase n=1 Tax=Solirhodobacter olei TaxID=2493082 RepID=UPI000FD836A4|nr:C45 family peptidase [Solirhodobacter olei]